MVKETRYVDVDDLIQQIQQIPIYLGSHYSSSAIEQAMIMTIEKSLKSSLESFKYQLIEALSKSGKPYSQCMLCVKREHDVIPPHPLGDSGRTS